jgi:hypothetical protein
MSSACIGSTENAIGIVSFAAIGAMNPRLSQGEERRPNIKRKGLLGMGSSFAGICNAANPESPSPRLGQAVALDMYLSMGAAVRRRSKDSS